MRATPSYTATANLGFTDWYSANPSSTTTTVNINQSNADFGNLNNSNFSGLTTARIYALQPNISSIFASSEL
jgi:hypothetical protein